mgnify:CR=1 FL=1
MKGETIWESVQNAQFWTDSNDLLQGVFMKKTFLIWLLGGILVLPILCQEFEGEEEMDPSDFLKNEKVRN